MTKKNKTKSGKGDEYNYADDLPRDEKKKEYSKLVKDFIGLKETVKKQQNCIKEKDQRIGVMEKRWNKFLLSGKLIVSVAIISLICIGVVFFVTDFYNGFTLSMTIIGIMVTVYCIVFVCLWVIRTLLNDEKTDDDIVESAKISFWFSLLAYFIIVVCLVVKHWDVIMGWGS